MFSLWVLLCRNHPKINKLSSSSITSFTFWESKEFRISSTCLYTKMLHLAFLQCVIWLSHALELKSLIYSKNTHRQKHSHASVTIISTRPCLTSRLCRPAASSTWSAAAACCWVEFYPDDISFVGLSSFRPVQLLPWSHGTLASC